MWKKPSESMPDPTSGRDVTAFYRCYTGSHYLRELFFKDGHCREYINEKGISNNFGLLWCYSDEFYNDLIERHGIYNGQK